MDAVQPRGFATADAVTIVSTPLYSNTTLVVCHSDAGPRRHGGADGEVRRRAVPAPCSDASRHACDARAGAISPAHGPPDFGKYDLSGYGMKFSTSAPFPAALKAEVLRAGQAAWSNIYGMTEGGGSTILAAHQFPDKLHTVGQPCRDMTFASSTRRAARSRGGRSARWSAVRRR